MTLKKRQKKIDLMEEAFDFIKQIPSVYDKTNRFDVTWEIWLDIDKGKFSKHIKLAYEDLLQSKDGEVTALRDLIDVAQQHDPKLANSFVAMLDNDEGRKKLKEPLLRRLEDNLKIKKACNQYDTLGKLTVLQFSKVFHKNLEELNSGRIVPKSITDTFEILENASKFTLNDGYEAYIYFILNASKKFESNKKDPDVLKSIFVATLENTKLIAILSSDNVIKMKNLYNTGKSTSLSKNPIISPGGRQIALEHIKAWLSLNLNGRIYIIDPYFTEMDLHILVYIKELNPSCHVTILTSKKSNINSHTDLDNNNRSINKEVYIRA